MHGFYRANDTSIPSIILYVAGSQGEMHSKVHMLPVSKTYGTRINGTWLHTITGNPSSVTDP